MIYFLDEDEAYNKWLGDNPGGFVVNAGRYPDGRYLVLHNATCGTISGNPAHGETWTRGDYSKTCAVDREELRRWAREAIKGELSPCGLCKP